MTLPALEGDANGAPYAFFAVVSICVIGLYIAYVMPVFLRWRMGDAFEPGPVDAGQQVQVDQPGGDHLGGDLRDHLLPAVHARRRPVARRVRLEVRQLRADLTVGVLLRSGSGGCRVRATYVHGPVRTIDELDATRVPATRRGPRRHAGRLRHDVAARLAGASSPPPSAVLAGPARRRRGVDAAVAAPRPPSRPGGRSPPPSARGCCGSPTRSRRAWRSSRCSRRATPASRSATRAARWAWSSTRSASTRARRSGRSATRSRSPAASRSRSASRSASSR